MGANMNAREKLAKLCSESIFKRWFETATFAEKGVEFSTSFMRDYVASHYEKHLKEAFGFYPELTVRKKEPIAAAPALVKTKPVEAVQIDKARRPKTGFSAREMILLNLPHSDQKEAPVWERKNGNLSLIVQGGYAKNPNTNELEYVGIPYGATARLLIFYLMSEAVLTKSPEISLGRSFDAFLETIGASKTGGKKSGAAAVLRQLQRLATANFSVQNAETSEEMSLFAVKNARFIDNMELWFSNKKKDQPMIFESRLKISQDLFESLKKAAVPLDWEIVVQLRKSPLALDLYALLSYESARAQKTERGRFIPWAALTEQMGSEYGTVKNFSQKAKRELAKIKSIYKGLSLGKRQGGIEIMADSLPSVERPALPPKKP